MYIESLFSCCAGGRPYWHRKKPDIAASTTPLAVSDADSRILFITVDGSGDEPLFEQE